MVRGRGGWGKGEAYRGTPRRAKRNPLALREENAVVVGDDALWFGVMVMSRADFLCDLFTPPKRQDEGRTLGCVNRIGLNCCFTQDEAGTGGQVV
jgi:hypothetical protein